MNLPCSGGPLPRTAPSVGNVLSWYGSVLAAVIDSGKHKLGFDSSMGGCGTCLHHTLQRAVGKPQACLPHRGVVLPQRARRVLAAGAIRWGPGGAGDHRSTSLCSVSRVLLLMQTDEGLCKAASDSR